jgi:hypothetical protein
MQIIYQVGIVTSQLYCNEWCNIKRGRFSNTKLHQRDCCEELGLQFNVSQLCVDEKFKQTASHFDHIKYGSIMVTNWGGGGRITEREWKNHQTVKHSTHCVTVYIHFVPPFGLFPYKLYTCTEGSCWNRPGFKAVSGSAVETQVSAEAGGTADTQTVTV